MIKLVSAAAKWHERHFNNLLPVSIKGANNSGADLIMNSKIKKSTHSVQFIKILDLTCKSPAMSPVSQMKYIHVY